MQNLSVCITAIDDDCWLRAENSSGLDAAFNAEWRLNTGLLRWLDWLCGFLSQHFLLRWCDGRAARRNGQIRCRYLLGSRINSLRNRLANGLGCRTASCCWLSRTNRSALRTTLYVGTKISLVDFVTHRDRPVFYARCKLVGWHINGRITERRTCGPCSCGPDRSVGQFGLSDGR